MIDLVCVFCELDLFRPSGGTREHLEKEEFFLEDTKNTPPQEGRAWRRYAGDPRENALPRELGAFLSVCKTEREAARFLEAALKDAGSSSVEQGKTLRPGDLVHLVWKNRAVAAARIGTTPLAQGFRLVGAHIDAPRVDVKPHPLYEDCGLAMIDGHYYGGVKKYQWTNVPLALHGEIHLAGGVAKTVVVGEDPSDPVLVIPDLAPHLDRETDKRTAKETILGENLDAIGASRPSSGEEKNAVLAALKSYLHDVWGVEEDDLVAADLALVPAGPAREVGFDRGLLGAYGIDDRACSFLAFRALLDLPTPEFTAVFLAVDKEEIGSEGVASAQGALLESFLRELLESTGGDTSPRGLRRCFARSEALSADVTEAANPLYKDAFDPHQLPVAGNGVTLMKYTGSGGKNSSSEAPGEFVARVLERFRKDRVPWQPGSLGKVDKGGGGTIAMFLARLGMDVVDVGPAVLSLHSPCEMLSKADVLSTCDAYRAFWIQ